MPRYYFDTVENGRSSRDEVGIDLPDDEAAREYVGTVLPDMAHNGLPDGDIHTFECTARDAAGRTVYHAEMTYHGHRIGPRSP